MKLRLPRNRYSRPLPSNVHKYVDLLPHSTLSLMGSENAYCVVPIADRHTPHDEVLPRTGIGALGNKLSFAVVL